MKNKKVISLFLIIAVCFSVWIFPDATSVNAAVSEKYASQAPELATKSDFKYSVRNERVYINEYIGTKTQIIIPNTIDSLPVFAVTSNSFKSSDITYIKIPKNVTLIASNAFNYCDSLLKIDVDSENEKFCSIDGVVYNKEKTSLKVFPAGRGGNFTIPEGITSIASYAFYRCYQLENINMYNTVTSIGERAFSFCWNLKTVRFSDNLESVSTMAFSHCNNLTQLHLPASIKRIESDAFLGKINSNNSSKEYYLVDGVYCVKNSYASKYIKSLGLKFIEEGRSFTDVDAGITIYDNKNTLPENVSLKVNIKSLNSIPVDFSDVNYTDALVFDIYFSRDGGVYAPSGSYDIDFTHISEKLIPSATKIYSYRVGDLNSVEFSLHQKNLKFKTDALGTYAVFLMNDFSLKGDANGDGKVTLADARLTLLAASRIISFTPEQASACDLVNVPTNSNKITIEDARRLLRNVAGLK